jgi:maltose alpha-D-glucosyltransferase / alpha-amylase
MNAPTSPRQLRERRTRIRNENSNDPLWYKDAIIYELHVKAFHDSNGDGIGDFQGLSDKLDYVKDLGVNTIWLLPFYPSPLRDDGYDIADYRGVHADYGTKGDFRQFVKAAHARGLRVITELVINHTSDRHPWFQAARQAPPGSAKRNYYVWSDDPNKWPETRIIFTDTESSNWAWDPVAKSYYWHRFFSHQPDLNFENPHVIRAVLKVMRYWLDMGVDGMRLDAIPYLLERDGTINENLPETHDVLKQMRAELDRHYRNRFFLAEVNQWPEDVREYFGQGDECHMAYHFPLMPRIYMAVAEEDYYPIFDILSQTPDIPDACQWASFLRNHDELTLEMVTQRERDYMYRTYAADLRMRINVGIRRRLAPLMENNRRKIELVNSLLMSLLGSPILYYGDEIGMGDNFYLGDRHGVRTPMQWSPDRNAGFSRADPERLYLPPIMDPIYGYQAVNVEAQSRSPSSLLNWMKRLIAVRKAHLAFGRGTLRLLRPGNRKILAYVREYRHADGREEIILCVANLSRSSQPVELSLREFNRRIPVELLGRTTFPPIGELPYLLTLPPWGFYWFELTTSAPYPEWHDERPVPAELPILVIPEGLHAMLKTANADAPHDMRTLMAVRVREQLESEVLPAFLANRRWYAGKGHTVSRVELVNQLEWEKWLLCFARVTFEDGSTQHYSLPLALAWEDASVERVQSLLHCTLARMRQRANVGVIYDAFWEDDFCRGIVAAMERNDRIPAGGGHFVFSSTSAFGKPDMAALPIEHPSFEQSNTMVILGERMVLKGYRRLQDGINPEIEVGHYLTEVARYPNIAALLGTVVYERDDGSRVALGVLQRFVENQGSGWNYTVEYLGRFLDTNLATTSREAAAGESAPSPSGPAPVAPSEPSPHGSFLALIETLGRRTGELHAALARTSGSPDFDPEPVSGEEYAAWVDKVRQDVTQTLAALSARRDSLTEAVRRDADALLGLENELMARIEALASRGVQASKSRYHGDYHLGQVLLSAHDFVIVDFEGEPSRPMAERRAKHSPLRDVAGMLRSFGYAAAVALNRATADRPQDRARVAPLLALWRRETEAVFLAAYREAAKGSATLPAPREDEARLIELFVIEKALYEVRYELDMRPDWLKVPVSGLLDLLTPEKALQNPA